MACEPCRPVRGKTSMPIATASQSTDPPDDGPTKFLVIPESWQAKPWKERRDLWVLWYMRGATQWGPDVGWYARRCHGRQAFNLLTPEERMAKVKEWYLRGVTWTKTDEERASESSGSSPGSRSWSPGSWAFRKRSRSPSANGWSRRTRRARDSWSTRVEAGTTSDRSSPQIE